MNNQQSDDQPKSLGSPQALATREAELCRPHIAPLTDFVDRLRVAKGPPHKIPYFDPRDGGTAAEVLFLLEAPGAKAVVSGFISRDNPDETARNFFMLNREAGISRERTVVWNIVPWYIGSDARIRPATSSDIEDGIHWLNPLFELLPSLRAIVLLGKKAQRGAEQIARVRPGIPLFKSPHPSPLFVNNSPSNRGKIVVVLREVADLLKAEAVA